MTTSAPPSKPVRNRRRRRLATPAAPARPAVDRRKRLRDLLKQDSAARQHGTPLLTAALRARIQAQLAATD